MTEALHEETRVGAPAEDGQASRRIAILFMRMWAVAHIIHLSAATSARLDSPWNIATVGAAILVILRPGGRWFAVLAAAQIADYVAGMPYSPDHWAMIAGVNAALLVGMAWRRSTSVETIAAGFPAARVILLVAYLASAVAKYNTSFLDPVASCATAIANRASFGLAAHLPPVWSVATVALETAIPVLLVIPATRRHGVRVGAAFHFALSASPAFAVVDFTSALYALFLLFLPAAEVVAFLDRLNRWAARSAIVRDARRSPPVTAALAFLVFGFLGYLLLPVARAVTLVFSELYLLAVLVALLLTWRVGRQTPRPFGRPMLVQVPVIVLVAIWAMSPYLGLRTAGVFTMFSNIRTEGSAPNHLFMPTVRLVDWQDDLVVVRSTNDPAMAAAGPGRVSVPLVELRRQAALNPSLEVTGTMNGHIVELGPREGQEHIEPLGLLERKLSLFRPVWVGPEQRCSNG